MVEFGIKGVGVALIQSFGIDKDERNILTTVSMALILLLLPFTFIFQKAQRTLKSSVAAPQLGR